MTVCFFFSCRRRHTRSTRDWSSDVCSSDLGIANEMQSKTVFPNPKTPAEVGVLVANGEAEIGVHLIQELMSVAGIDLVGPLPGDLQATTVFSEAIMTGAKDAATAKALVDFLRTPESAKVIKANGMEPATP